jgi:hypothetical protein
MATAAPEAPATPAVVEPKPLKLEKRTFKVNDSEVSFDFLRIEKPEDWKPASEFKTSIRLTMGSGRAVKLAVRALSYQEWVDIEYRNPMPELTGDMKPDDEDYLAKQAVAKSNRQIAVFELSTGKPVPGNSIAEKSEWLMQLGTSESKALYEQILEHCSGVNEGDQVLTMTAISGMEEHMNVMEASSLEDLLTASQAGTTFRFQRPFEKYICEFALKQFTEKRKQEIDAACKDPMPPSKPGKDPTTGLPSSSATPIYNWNDIRYLEALSSINKVRVVMRCESILPFAIPGADLNEKYKWIGQRLLGDVIKLQSYVENELLSYRRRLLFT